MGPLDDYYSVKDFAKLIGRAEPTVRRWINRQIIPAVKIGSLHLIPKADLIEFLHNNVIGALIPSKKIVKSIRQGLTKPSLHNQKALNPRTTAGSHEGRYVQDKD